MSYYAIDCEMAGGNANQNVLVRVSLVDNYGSVVYDEIVSPRPSDRPISDYRDRIHGIDSRKIENGISFNKAKTDVWKIISGKRLIGHSLDVDLDVLELSDKVPSHLRKDLATHAPFKKYNPAGKPSLKVLAENILYRTIQKGYHSSVEDAKACMDIYNKYNF